MFPYWYIQAGIGLVSSFGAVSDPGMQLVASYNAGGSFGTALGLLRSAGAGARIFAPFAAGALYDVEFGAFIGRKRLLSFWGKEGGDLYGTAWINTDTHTPQWELHVDWCVAC